ncbi:HAMP domain-containing sensor histidine kinase [Halioxenophilus aromaticivorans]|uniref:sensor histidine kinase n=1 Tax=Halioxenophilus aromaticivorans TaxID=1306992 RepID=UPI0031E669BD
MSAVKAVHGLLQPQLCESNPDEMPEILASFKVNYGYKIQLVERSFLSTAQQAELNRNGRSITTQLSPFGKRIVSFVYPSRCINLFVTYKPLADISSDALYFVFLLVFLVLGIGVAVFFVAWPMIKHTNTMVRAAHAIAKGDLGREVAEDLPQPLDRLAVSINRATRTITRLITEQELLTSSASHEFRTPITRLFLALDIAKKERNPQQLHAQLCEMERDTEQLEQLVTEFMAYSKFCYQSAELKRSLISPYTLLQEICLRLRPLKPELKISFDCVGDVDFYGEKKSIERALVNLISNGQKYGKSLVWITVTGDENNVYIMVSDDGSAIPKEYREKVLQPFYRMDNTQSSETSGYGLGLAIVNKIASMHAGRLAIKDNDIGGTTVKLTIPR